MNTGFQLGEFLPFRLTRLAEHVSQSLANVYAERFELSVPQWRVLAILQETPGMSATAVAERCNLDKVKVSRAVSGLERRKLLIRRRDARDARSSELRLSAAGMQLFSEIAPLALHWEREFLNALEPRERQSLLVTLAQLELGLNRGDLFDMQAQAEEMRA
jgi:DNA-binding MarR family transcriptional regulator